MHKLLLGLQVALVSSVVFLAAQAPTFEAASIKRSTAENPGTSIGQRPGGQFVMTNGPILSLILSAFGPQSTELVGAPEWVTSERYDLLAKAGGTTTSEDLRAMLRGLLQERLKLAAHMEGREQPVYLLKLARPDGRLGPQLQKADRDCGAVTVAVRSGVAPPTLSPPSNGAPPCGMRAGGGEITSGGITMELLARNLGSRSGRFVLDRTGLEGYFDFTLKFSADPNASDAPSVFTALQEQLGLKLEADRAPLQTLVIDHIERPTEN